MILTRIKRIALALVLAGYMLLSPSVAAATGTLYLSPASGNLGNGAEVSLALRINPGTSINGVQAEVGYDAGKLQLVSVSEDGTAFPDIAEQNTEANPVTLTRATSTGSVNSDSLIITFHFKALASNGSTTISVAGNAAQGSNATNPSVQGATITFDSSSGSTSPPPASPQAPRSPNPSTPSPRQSTNATPEAQSTTELPQENTTSATITQPAPKGVKRFWWIGVLAIVALAAGGFWLIRRRKDAADIAIMHPIDTTWANTKPKAAIKDLLARVPGVNNQDPGSIITPKKSDDKNQKP